MQKLLLPHERCPAIMRAANYEVFANAVEARIYPKHTNLKPRYGARKSSLPAMLKTPQSRYGLGGILAELYKKYTGKMFWIKGYNGFLVAIPPTYLAQFYLPLPIIQWAFFVESEEHAEKVGDFISRLDTKIARSPKWPSRRELKWWFPSK